MSTRVDDAAGVVTLLAPLSGVLVPIEAVPDAVFAQKLVGDGVSIDPTSPRVLAPTAGTIVQIHPAGHALTLRSEEGLEIMIHVGLDTVKLKGAGFRTLVAEGDAVAAGDGLIDFDVDEVARSARSLLTQVVITNGERVASLVAAHGLVEAGVDTILTIETALADASRDDSGLGESVVSEAIIVPNPAGIHARPAAVLAAAARGYRCSLRLRKGDAEAEARSVVALMALNVKQGDTVNIVARGADAEEAVADLLPLLRSGLGEAGVSALSSSEASQNQAVIVEDDLEASVVDEKIVTGVAAAPGLAVGVVRQHRRAEIAYDEDADDPHRERRRLDDALEGAKIALEALVEKFQEETDTSKAEIFSAHRQLLEDPDLVALAAGAIAKGKSAEGAWHCAFTTQAELLASLDNALLAGRATDVRDVGRRVLARLAGVADDEASYGENTILVAEDLTPTDAAALDRELVKGFCTVGGGATSHVAILARSLGFPAVVGAQARVLDVPDGTAVVIDGGNGTLRLGPTEEEMGRIRARQVRLDARREADREAALEPAITRDGHRVCVVANVAGPEGAVEAVPLGAEGVGLLRSEFLFMERRSAPTEDEQAQAYRRTAEALGKERSLTVRTLDVGGDKPLTYMPIPEEENPFLGERGIRVCLTRKAFFRAHLRAILRVADLVPLRIMFPMVATLDEWRQGREILDEEARRLGVTAYEAGIMVEVPSAALRAEAFAREVDFLSIGTNDLTQYTLAMDRGHAKLAPRIDALEPAVLALVARTVEGAHRHGKTVSVCGGAASDPQALPILVGLGVDKLSCAVPSLPAVKAAVRRLDRKECELLAKKALEADGAATVRALVPDGDARDEEVGQ